MAYSGVSRILKLRGGGAKGGQDKILGGLKV